MFLLFQSEYSVEWDAKMEVERVEVKANGDCGCGRNPTSWR
jgi:hypothetical protein